MKIYFKIVFLTLMLFHTSLLFSAQTDCPVQLALADQSGTPITASVDYEVHFYSAASGGTELALAQIASTTPSGGLLNIPLTCTAALLSNPSIFLEFVINGEALSPRVEMASTPFAGTAFAVAGGAITSSEVLDGTITNSDINNSAGITYNKLSFTDNITSSDIATGAITTTEISDATITASDVEADAFDFLSLSDSLTLDASTTISETGSNTLNITNSGTGSSLVINDQPSDTTPIVFTSSGDLVIGGVTGGLNEGSLNVGAFIQHSGQDVTVNSNGNGTAAIFTITPRASFVQIVCNDFDGCSGDISETGAQGGRMLYIVNESGNPVTITGSGADARIVGGTITLGNNDSITLIYGSFNWIELSRSDN